MFERISFGLYMYVIFFIIGRAQHLLRTSRRKWI